VNEGGVVVGSLSMCLGPESFESASRFVEKLGRHGVFRKGLWLGLHRKGKG